MMDPSLIGPGTCRDKRAEQSAIRACQSTPCMHEMRGLGPTSGLVLKPVSQPGDWERP